MPGERQGPACFPCLRRTTAISANKAGLPRRAWTGRSSHSMRRGAVTVRARAPSRPATGTENRDRGPAKTLRSESPALTSKATPTAQTSAHLPAARGERLPPSLQAQVRYAATSERRRKDRAVRKRARPLGTTTSQTPHCPKAPQLESKKRQVRGQCRLLLHVTNRPREREARTSRRRAAAQSLRAVV